MVTSQGDNYLGDCSLFDATAAVMPSLVVAPNTMMPNTTYAISLSIQSEDGRSASTSISVMPVLEATFVFGVSSTSKRVNMDQKVTITGSLMGNFSVMATWAVYFDNQLQAISTNLTSIFTS